MRLDLPSGRELAELVDRLVRAPEEDTEPEPREALAVTLVARESA